MARFGQHLYFLLLELFDLMIFVLDNLVQSGIFLLEEFQPRLWIIEMLSPVFIVLERFLQLHVFVSTLA